MIEGQLPFTPSNYLPTQNVLRKNWTVSEHVVFASGLPTWTGESAALSASIIQATTESRWLLCCRCHKRRWLSYCFYVRFFATIGRQSHWCYGLAVAVYGRWSSVVMDPLFKTTVMVLPPWPIVAAKQCSCCDRDWPITTILLGLISISRRFPGLYSLTKSLRQANRLQEAMQSSFSVIQQCGEELPLPMGNKQLDNKIQSMNQILQNTEDKSILGMVEASNKKVGLSSKRSS